MAGFRDGPYLMRRQSNTTTGDLKTPRTRRTSAEEAERRVFGAARGHVKSSATLGARAYRELLRLRREFRWTTSVFGIGLRRSGFQKWGGLGSKFKGLPEAGCVKSVVGRDLSGWNCSGDSPG